MTDRLAHLGCTDPDVLARQDWDAEEDHKNLAGNAAEDHTPLSSAPSGHPQDPHGHPLSSVREAAQHAATASKRLWRASADERLTEPMRSSARVLSTRMFWLFCDVHRELLDDREIPSREEVNADDGTCH